MPNTKTVLSREYCKNEYKRKYKEKMRACVGVYLILFFFGLLGALLCIPLMKGIFVIGILYFVVFALVVFLVVWQTAFEIRILKKLDRGEFSIVKDEVCRKVEGEVPDLLVGRFSFGTTSFCI